MTPRSRSLPLRLCASRAVTMPIRFARLPPEGKLPPEAFGYPKASGGNLTSGGSLANLIGIVTARDAHNLKGRDLERGVIYLTHQAHHSIDKAIRIAGLKECVVRHIPLDAGYRMN